MQHLSWLLQDLPCFSFSFRKYSSQNMLKSLFTQSKLFYLSHILDYSTFFHVNSLYDYELHFYITIGACVRVSIEWVVVRGNRFGRTVLWMTKFKIGWILGDVGSYSGLPYSTKFCLKKIENINKVFFSSRKVFVDLKVTLQKVITNIN